MGGDISKFSKTKDKKFLICKKLILPVDFFWGGPTTKRTPHARFCCSGAYSQSTLNRERYDVRVF